MHLITFSNLFPSSVTPNHGLFVYERMRRVADRLREELGDRLRWSVVAPVPDVLRPLRRGIYQTWAKVPLRETWQGVDVHHPRFRHWPGLSQNRQADAVRRGCRKLVASLMREHGPAVLDAHYLWPDGVAAAELARELGLPFTLTARGSDVNVLGQVEQIAARLRAVAPQAHACMAVSDALSQRFAEVAGLPAGSPAHGPAGGPAGSSERGVVTMRNGVDLTRFAPSDGGEAGEARGAARQQLGLDANGQIVLGVGRLVAAKGWVEAARACAELPDTTLVLVGEGEAQASIAAAAPPGRVRFLGAQPPERVAVAYRAADAFVLPSHREGWPNVVTEALASGLPVVATRVGGIPQILAGDPPEPSLGALVDVGDVTALRSGLAAALARVAADPQGERARVRSFAERYGWQEPVEQLAAIFQAAARLPCTEIGGTAR
ncbi:MAG: glycosyltransferase [Planctomycetota bacterium]